MRENNDNDKRKKTILEKKKANFQSMFQDATQGRGKETIGGSVRIMEAKEILENKESKSANLTAKVYLTNRRDVIPVQTNLIEINPLNKEFFTNLSGREWESFKEDIEKRGIIQPLIAYQNSHSNRWILIDGEQRLKAALELGLGSVPVQVTEAPENKEAERQFLIKANLLRRQLSQDQKQKLYRALSKEERLNFYLEKYGRERLLQEERGGDTKNKKTISKLSTDNFESEKTLKKEILEDTRLPEGTVNRDLAQLRRKLKLQNQTERQLKTKNFFHKIEQDILKLSKEINQEEAFFRQRVKEIRQKKNTRVKKLKEQLRLKEKELKKILTSAGEFRS